MKKIRGDKERPRLIVFRSNRAIYAQIIDDKAGKTLVAASERDLAGKVKKPPVLPSRPRLDSVEDGSTRRGRVKGREVEKQAKKKTKTEKARMVGEMLAQKALAEKITKTVFDRRRYKYHGRVKALAGGARKGGLDF